jgi:endoglucanase
MPSPPTQPSPPPNCLAGGDFNLMKKFTLRHNSPYLESDFEWMAEWGFDFVRLPTELPVLDG